MYQLYSTFSNAVIVLTEAEALTYGRSLRTEPVPRIVALSTITEHTADATAVHLHDARVLDHTSQGLSSHVTSRQKLNFRLQ